MLPMLAVSIGLASVLAAQSSTSQRAAWNRPVPPFRVAGNVYYVGAAGVSSFLITTPQGHILLDGGLPETAPLIEKNIAALGFRLTDVKYLLNSHAHFDHAGGLAELKRLSGAQMAASRADARALEAGHHIGMGTGVHSKFPPVKVDRVVGDMDTISVGGTVLTAHLTPGHTMGCTTWTMPVREAGAVHQAVFFCSISVVARLVGNREYPQIVSDYEASFANARKLPCDIFLGPHPEFFDLAGKRARMRPGAPNPFIDAAEFPRFLDAAEQNFRDALKSQQTN